MMLKLWAIGSMTLILAASSVGAYELDTHETMSESAVLESVLSKNPSVLKDLGLPQANEEVLPFDGKPRSILNIVGRGARLEDTLTSSRPINHFFDPTRAGDANNGAARGFVSILNPISSPSWALEDGQAHGGQDNSFRDARRYLLGALISGPKSTREGSFASTFQTLGMVIHHLRDIAYARQDRSGPCVFKRVVAGGIRS